MKSQRFVSRTESINLKKLERETRKLLYLGFVVAVCFNALTAAFFSFKRIELRIPRPITVGLIIRPPRLVKPFIIRKKGIRKKFTYKKTPYFRKPSRDLTTKPLPQVDTFNLLETLRIYPDSLFYSFKDPLTIRKLPEKAVKKKRLPYDPSLEAEMLSIEDLDYGKYKSLIVRNPFYKRLVAGFVYIPVSIWGADLLPLKRPVIGLAEALKKYSHIKPKLDQRLFLSSSAISKYPFLYITTIEGFDLTVREKRNFVKYLQDGGFAVLDNGFPQDKYSGAEASLRQMLWDAKNAIGSSAFIAIIPPVHPIYHCFYDFPYGPPLGAALIPPEDFNITKEVIDPEYHPVQQLVGLWIGSRLAAVYSDMGYGLRWSQIANNTPQQKFGINMVVFALTQMGGLTDRQTGAFAAVRK